jgi:hypothetical protein
LFSGEIGLWVVKDLSTGMINVQSTARIAIGSCVAAKSIKMTATIRADEVITGNACTRLEVIVTKSCARGSIRARVFGGWGATAHFCHETRTAFDVGCVDSSSGWMNNGKNRDVVEGMVGWVVRQQAISGKH